jgi:hypothetical protein
MFVVCSAQAYEGHHQTPRSPPCLLPACLPARPPACLSWSAPARPPFLPPSLPPSLRRRAFDLREEKEFLRPFPVRVIMSSAVESNGSSPAVAFVLTCAAGLATGIGGAMVFHPRLVSSEPLSPLRISNCAGWAWCSSNARVPPPKNRCGWRANIFWQGHWRCLLGYVYCTTPARPPQVNPAALLTLVPFGWLAPSLCRLWCM